TSGISISTRRPMSSRPMSAGCAARSTAALRWSCCIPCAARDIACVRPTRLLRTTAFRLAIGYAVLFGGAVAILFVVVWWATTTFAEEQMRAAISGEVAALAGDAGSGDLARLARAIDARLGPTGRRAFDYLLLDPEGRRLAGNMSASPPAAGWSTPPPTSSESDREAGPDAAPPRFRNPR